MRRIVTAEDYFDAALEILVTEGGNGLRVGALCSSLGVTSGSFYGYFPSFDAFVEHLMTARLADQNRRLDELARSTEPAEARFVALRELARTVPHKAEAAIRSWVQGHAQGAALQRRLDEQRVDALVGVLLPVVGSAQAARELAEIGMSFLVGWQHLDAELSPDDFDRIFEEFELMARRHRPAELQKAGGWV